MESEKDQSMSWQRVFVSMSIVCVATALITSLICFHLFTQPTCERSVQLPSDKFDYAERLYDAQKDVTVMKAVRARKCFIKQGNGQSRAVYDIVDAPLNRQALRLVFGDQVADFCAGRTAYVLQQVMPDARSKRQTEAEGPPTDVGGRASNGCQNNQVVDCASDNVSYTCNTGPGEVYAATIQCEAPTTFNFSLVRRCNQFKGTKNQRFVKCLVAFLDGTKGEALNEGE